VSGSTEFAQELLLTAVVVVAAVLSNRITQRLLVPAPALMLAAAAVAVQVLPALHHPPPATVEHLVTVALVLILFDGGMGIGWPAFRAAAPPIGLVGVLGTFLTTLGVAAAAHWLVGLDWYAAVLVATAVAPTDPAVVFSVLGEREVSGRSGTVLEGESGANDPVGIALMASLLAAGGLSGSGLGHVAGEFALQMAVGLVVGVLGGRALLWFMRRVPLPGEGLYPLRTLAGALALFGATVLLHGSGFLAVFVAGIVIGDSRAPYKREIEHFHSALASLGEIVAFVALGLTVHLSDLVDPRVWGPGLVVWVVLAAIVRPLALEPLLTGSGLQRHEKSFVMFAGLKGAVPILLGSLPIARGLAGGERLFALVGLVVVFSLLAQGLTLGRLARRLGI
jgi:cell volume regulation protein A